MTRFTASELDADDRPVPILAEAPDNGDPAHEMDDALRRLTLWIGASRDVVVAGRRWLTAAHLLRFPGSATTIRELAQRLGVSKSRAGQLCMELAQEIGLRSAKTGQIQ